MALHDQVYPFSTQDGKAIPLDIIKPHGLLVKGFTPAAGQLLSIPANKGICTLFATEDCIISFQDTLPVALVDETLYPDTILVPANMFITVAIDENAADAYIKAVAVSGILYMQFLEKWSGLSLPIQSQRK